MGKKLDKKAKAAVGKGRQGASRPLKLTRPSKSSANSRASCGLASTCSRLPSSMERRCSCQRRRSARRRHGTLAGEHHKLLTSEKSVELVRSVSARDGCRRTRRRARSCSTSSACSAATSARQTLFPPRRPKPGPLTCEADAVWHKAKAANDWASFEPYVDRIVAQLKHQAELMDPKRDPYDVWLDQYERGLSAKSFDAFCDEVKATVVPLVHAIGERGQQPDADFLHARVPRGRPACHELRPYEACRPGPGRHHACLYRAPV